MDLSVQTQLFVELLNHYVYFYEKGNDQVIFKKVQDSVCECMNDFWCVDICVHYI